MHCPYPSLDTRAAMAATHRCPRKDIDHWFVDARRRVGWNALRKSSFDNKRAKIVDAATRCFVKPDPKRPLEDSLEGEFSILKANIQHLCSKTVFQSALARRLDEAVPDMDPSAARRPRTKSQKAQHQRDGSPTDPCLSYPSPARSSSPCLSPSASRPSTPQDPCDAPQPSKKRRASEDLADCEPQNKRSKYVSTLRCRSMLSLTFLQIDTAGPRVQFQFTISCRIVHILGSRRPTTHHLTGVCLLPDISNRVSSKGTSTSTPTIPLRLVAVLASPDPHPIPRRLDDPQRPSPFGTTFEWHPRTTDRPLQRQLAFDVHHHPPTRRHSKPRSQHPARNRARGPLRSWQQSVVRSHHHEHHAQ